MVKFIRERLSADDFNTHLFQTRWGGSIHAHARDIEQQMTLDLSRENISTSSKVASWMLVWSFVRRNYVLAIFPIIALYFPFKYSFTKDAWILFVYTLTTGNWLLEGLPFEMICLPPIIMGLHASKFNFGTIGEPQENEMEYEITDSKELMCLAGAILSNAIVKTNLHRRLSWYFIYISDTRPQKVLAVIVIMTAITNVIMAPILTITVLHPFCSAILESINDCRKIRMSQEGAGRKDKSLNDYEFQKFSAAVRLAVPFAANITNIAVFNQNNERHVKLDMKQFLPSMLLLVPGQLFLLWVILVIRFVGYHKLWNWSSRVENMYAYYLIRTERRDRPKMSFTEITVIMCIIYLILLSLARSFRLRAHFMDDCYMLENNQVTCEMDLERSTLIIACILMMMPAKSPNLSILGNYTRRLPRGRWRPLLNWKDDAIYLPWDVVMYILCSDIFISEFQKSKLVETMQKKLIYNLALDLVMMVLLLTAKVMIYNNLLNPKLVTYMFLTDIGRVARELKINPLLFVIIVEVASKYHFIFPFTSLNNMLAYSAGGITKADMITCGFLVWIMCYLTFIIHFLFMIPYYDLHDYSYSQLVEIYFKDGKVSEI